MDKSVERYRERRDARLKKRLDDEWITIKGTHVMVDDDKKITKGPENLKRMSVGSNKAIPAKNLPPKESTPLRNGSRTVSSKKGSGETPSTGAKETSGEYKKIPYGALTAGGKYATPEEKKQKRETISRFMKEAQTGDVYKVGGGVGSSGAEFKVIERGDGKKYLQWKSDRYSKPVLMNRANVESYIANGAKKIGGESDKEQGSEGGETRSRKMRSPSYLKISDGMTGNITKDINGEWAKNVNEFADGTTFSVKTGNRWHDEVETYTRTPEGWSYERTVDGKSMDKWDSDSKAMLSRMWNSINDGIVLKQSRYGKR